MIAKSNAAARAGLPGALLALTALFCGGIAPPAAARPNFVFLFADDLGWGDLPAFGRRSVRAHGGWIEGGELQTPHLDRMAAEGIRFTQFYVASAVCSPSRAGILTSRFPGETGIHDYLGSDELNRQRGCVNHLDPALPTVTGLLQRAGYATAHFGKWHLGGRSGPPPERYGIDRYDNCLRGPDGRVRSSECIADEAIRFLEANRGRPFFVNAWFYDPHSPLHPTEEMMAPYAALNPGWGEHKGAMQVYYAVLTELDRQIGRILDTLDRLGLSENTVVVFASDNGPESAVIPFTSHYGAASSAGPFRGLKRSLYEGGIRTPFILRWKGTAPAGRVDGQTVVSGVDILPTFCALAGVTTPEAAGSDGEDMSAAFRGRTVERRRPLLWENRFPVYGHVLGRSPMLAIRQGKWKLLLNPDRSRVELYDIPADPAEINNRASEHPEIVERLAKVVLSWRDTLPRGPVHPDAGRNDYPWPKSASSCSRSGT